MFVMRFNVPVNNFSVMSGRRKFQKKKKDFLVIFVQNIEQSMF